LPALSPPPEAPTEEQTQTSDPLWLNQVVALIVQGIGQADYYPSVSATGLESASVVSFTHGGGERQEDSASSQSVSLDNFDGRDRVLLPQDVQSEAEETATTFWQSSRMVIEYAFESSLNEWRQALATPDAGRTMYAAVSVTFSAGYLLFNLRNLYLLAGMLLSRPLWNPLDPLALLESENEEEEKLKPIFDGKK
jgi:hypothetical protein